MRSTEGDVCSKCKIFKQQRDRRAEECDILSEENEILKDEV